MHDRENLVPIRVPWQISCKSDSIIIFVQNKSLFHTYHTMFGSAEPFACSVPLQEVDPNVDE